MTCSGIVWACFCHQHLPFHNLTCSVHKNTVKSKKKLKKKKTLTTQGPNDVSGVIWACFCHWCLPFHKLTCSAHKKLDMYNKIVSLKKDEEKKTLTT